MRVTLPAAWLRAPTRLRANVTARSMAPLERPALDVGARVVRLAARGRRHGAHATRSCARSRRRRARSCRSRAAGRRCGAADVKRALRFLERRRQGVGFVELVRAVSGLETDEAGLELGAVHARPLARRAALRQGRALPPARDAGGDAARPVPVPGEGARLAADARRPRDRRDPGRRHGARQDGAGDRDARVGARGVRARRRSGRRSSSAR